ncbi:MAG: SDR family oxidoreductase [Bacteroidota bacterium]
MDLGLASKVFIVTGGSSGIGAAISKGIAAEGGIPVIATMDRPLTQKMMEAFRAAGQEAHAIILELGPAANSKKVIDETIAKYGRLDGIVNNAGINDGASLEKGPQAFRRSLQINLHHVYDLVHYGQAFLAEAKGAIVNIASKVAQTGQGDTSGYAAAKGAILALTREWAVAFLKDSVRVNAILPAEVMTPLYRQWLDTHYEDPSSAEQAIANKIPYENRMTTPEEIANSVLFLLSDKASHTTGQFYYVDGGYVHLDRRI